MVSYKIKRVQMDSLKRKLWFWLTFSNLFTSFLCKNFTSTKSTTTYDHIINIPFSSPNVVKWKKRHVPGLNARVRETECLTWQPFYTILPWPYGSVLDRKVALPISFKTDSNLKETNNVVNLYDFIRRTHYKGEDVNSFLSKSVKVKIEK